jgi:hypothetical protein
MPATRPFHRVVNIETPQPVPEEGSFRRSRRGDFAFRPKVQAVATAIGILAVGLGANPGEVAAQPRPSKPGRLDMTEPVACESITGYSQYVPLEEAAVTKDDKLLIYYEPRNYAIKRVGAKYQIHLTQDVRIRRRGQKPVLWSKDKLFEFQKETEGPPSPICMMNKIAVKQLAPGEYDLDVILHDLAGNSPPAQQTLRFRVKPSAPSPAGKESKDEPDDPRQSASSPASSAGGSIGLSA